MWPLLDVFDGLLFGRPGVFVQESREKKFPVTAQVRPGSVLLLLLCLFFAHSSLIDKVTREYLCNASAREYFAVSSLICEHRTHMTSISGNFDNFWLKSTISRFRFRGSARHCGCNAPLRVSLTNLWSLCQCLCGPHRAAAAVKPLSC